MKALEITRDFGKLKFFIFNEDSSAPVLLGLSGFGCTHYNYLELVPELAKNFKIVLIDNRGMGESEKTSADYTLKEVAQDALAVMDHLGIKTFGVMGISMGGFIAQELMNLAPERINALALMCTLSAHPDFIHPQAITEAGLRQFNTIDVAMQAELSTMATVHPGLKERAPEQYRRIVDYRIKFKADIEETVRQNRAAVGFINGSFDLSVIKCPTLAMAGENDRFVNPENVKAFAKNINKCQTQLVPETDHFFFLEKPVMVSEVLNRFFKEILL